MCRYFFRYIYIYITFKNHLFNMWQIMLIIMSVQLMEMEHFIWMGIMAAITPKVRLHKTIPKIKVTPEEIARIGAINIKYHKDPSFTDSIKYNIPMKYEDGFVNQNLDLLWKCSGFFSKPQPSWQGVMQMIHWGSHPGKSSIKFLPMIDMSSSDPSCIYSTLSFVSEHANKYNSTPIIIFYQPLWLKAFLIV